MGRIATFTEVLQQDPSNTFARYGLAMEYATQGDSQKALAQFEELVAQHPDYVPAYQMAGQLLLKLDETESARRWLANGLAAAERSHNTHAHSEISAMLDELPDP